MRTKFRWHSVVSGQLLGTTVILFLACSMITTSLTGSGIAVAASDWQHVYFRESSEVVRNPHMGWVYIDNAVPGSVDAGRSVPLVRDGTAWGEVDNVAVLSVWGLIEREPGVYDWSTVDRAVDYWSSQGKTIHFRLSTDPMVIPLIDVNVGPPSWLYEQGLPYMVREEVDVEIRFPDYTHPLYFTHLERFLEAFAQRYKDHPAVEMVDLRGYGTWGEWHSGHDLGSLEIRRDVLKRITDAWSDAFGNTMLALSNSYEWRTEIEPFGISINQSPKPSYEEYVLASGFDDAFARSNVSLRRDGVAGYVFDEFDGRFIHDFFQSTRRPITSEIAGGFTKFHNWQVPGYTPRRAIDEALGYHSNYIMLMGWDLVGYDVSGSINADSALYFYNRESQGLMQYALRHMGYRLVPVKVKFPKVVASGASFDLFHTWENRGQGRLYEPYRLGVFLLLDGQVVWSDVDATSTFSHLVSGETAYMHSRFTLPHDIKAGTYTLALALVDQDETPRIRLAVEGHEDETLLEIGQVTVQRTTQGVTDVTSKLPGGLVRSGNTLVISGQDVGMTEAGTYRITFQYRTNEAPYEHVGAPGDFKFTVQTASGTPVSEPLTWRDEPGSEWGSKSIFIVLSQEDNYRLEWTTGTHGIVEINDVRVERIPEARAWHAELTTLDGVDVYTPDKVVSSEGLVLERKFDPMRYRDEDFVLLATDPSSVKLDPSTSYTVQFRVRQLTNKGYGSYSFARINSSTTVTDEEPIGEIRWQYGLGSPSTALSFTVHTGRASDARIEWGVHNGGAMVIDDIVIVRHP